MEHRGAQIFLQALSPAEQARLLAWAAQARQVPPAAYVPWFCGEQRLGWLAPPRAERLLQQLDGLQRQGAALVWQASDWSSAQRSACLQQVLLHARSEGLLHGWRDERFSFWHTDCVLPKPELQSLLDVERSGFRFLGMQSHAVHVNGFLPDGRLWVGRRSAHKATDPGMLDNLTAGGLPTGETVLQCLQRELAEEAGLFDLATHAWESAGQVRCSRLEPQGWHDESVQVVNLGLAADFVPHNQDGEVQEFFCLRAPEVLALVDQNAFTADAVQSLVQGLCGFVPHRTSPSETLP